MRETLALLDHLHALHAAVDLVGGSIQYGRLGRFQPDRLQDVEGAQGVDLKILPRIEHRRGHRHLAGQVQDRVRALDRLRQQRLIAHVAAHEGPAPGVPLAQPDGPNGTCRLVFDVYQT